MRREEGKWGDGGNYSESPENYTLRLVHLVIYLKTGSKVLGYDGSKTQKVKLNNNTEAICFSSSSVITSVNMILQYPQAKWMLSLLESSTTAASSLMAIFQ